MGQKIGLWQPHKDEVLRRQKWSYWDLWQVTPSVTTKQTTPFAANYRLHTRQDRWTQKELAFTSTKNATKPNPFKMIPLQPTRKENNWETKETTERTTVTLETERAKWPNPGCLWWWHTGWSVRLVSYLFVFGATAPQWARASLFTMFLDQTRSTTVGRTPLGEWSARPRDLYLTKHNTHNTQTFMPPVGFEPTISTGERPQTYDLDRAVTGTGATFLLSGVISRDSCILHSEFCWLIYWM